MSAAERFLFDLNGFLIVRGVFSPDEVAAANAAIDRHEADACERVEAALRNTQAGTALAGDGHTGRRDLGGMLGWSGGDAAPFRSLLAHPRLAPYLNELLGPGYRLDHQPLCILSRAGCDGFALHGGTVDATSGRYNPELAYHFAQGRSYVTLLAASLQLSDHNAGDGGFLVLPGSHKAQLPVPAALMNGDAHTEHLVQPITRAGDVVLFSEGTVHGAAPWTPVDRERRIALYRFAPATLAYGRSYAADAAPAWPAAFTAGMTDAQRAVLLPPFHPRLDRPVVTDGGELAAGASRAPVKKAFDRRVFGTEYF